MIPRPSTPSSKRSRAAGFSLIESMIVVAVVGLMAASMMPGMVEMFASTKQQSAANELMLLARRARREAVLGKFAHVLLFQENAGTGTGAVQVATGITGRCDRATRVGYGADPFTGIPLLGWQSAVGAMSFGTFSFGSHLIFGRMEMPLGQARASVRLCYASNGETHVEGPGLVTGEQTLPGVMFIRRTINGQARGVDRQVVFLPGGTARVR